MAEKSIRTRIALKRGTEAELSASNPKLLKGELYFVDTNDGLKAKVGDGDTLYNDLSYFNDVLQRGYYLNSKFYTDSTYTKELVKSINYIYIDLNSSGNIYYYDGTGFNPAVTIPFANDTTAGIMKLYDCEGENTDGTMTQRAITESAKNGIYDEDDEVLILTHVDFDNEYVEKYGL